MGRERRPGFGLCQVVVFDSSAEVAPWFRPWKRLRARRVTRATLDRNTNGTEIRAAISAWVTRLPAPWSLQRQIKENATDVEGLRSSGWQRTALRPGAEWYYWTADAPPPQGRVRRCRLPITGRCPPRPVRRAPLSARAPSARASWRASPSTHSWLGSRW